MNEPQPVLPLTIISGYLGSGKTTLVNHLLRHADGRRIMVMVNDFGDLPIDADLIESEEGNKINLSNGCACCSMGGDLYNALVEVLDYEPRPDHLLIEASGVADPARLANIAMAEPELVLDSILSLVDCEQIVDLLNDTQIGETVGHQISCSDLILLNKLDLIDPSGIVGKGALLENLAPKAKIAETEFAQIPVDMALGLRLSDHSNIENHQLDEHHSATFRKWSWQSDQPVNRDQLAKFLDNLDGHIFRLKGIVYFPESDVPQIVQFVGKRYTITASENIDHGNSGYSRLIAIGPAGQTDAEHPFSGLD